VEVGGKYKKTTFLLLFIMVNITSIQIVSPITEKISIKADYVGISLKWTYQIIFWDRPVTEVAWWVLMSNGKSIIKIFTKNNKKL